MAIQNRRGDYADYDPTKMVEGEFAFVLSGDPAGADGQSVYASFQNGSAKRLATYEDMEDNIDRATTSIQQDLTQGVNTAISDAQSAVRTMQSDIADTISDAETAVDGLESDVSSAITQAQTDIGTIQSDYQVMKSDNSNQLYNMQTSVNDAIDNIQGSATRAVAAADYAIEQADEVRRILEDGAVASFNGRTGSVVPTAGDYNSTQITHGTNSTVSDALAAKQNTLIQGQGINITNNVISADISSIEIPDPHDVIYGGTITAQGQGILAAIGSAHNAIEITAGAVFDVQYPLLYAPDEIENLTTGTGDTLGIYAIYGTATTPSDITSPVAYAPIYIVGTVSGTSFTVDSTTPYTQTLPNSEDGKIYMLVGNTGNSGSSYVFSPSEKLFAYMDGAIQVISPYALRLAIKYVAKSGDTMTGSLNVEMSGNAAKLRTIDPAVTLGTNPSEQVTSGGVAMIDGNGSTYGNIYTYHETNGRVNMALSIANKSSPTAGMNTSNNLIFRQKPDGTHEIYVRSPEAWQKGIGITSDNVTKAYIRQTASDAIQVHNEGTYGNYDFYATTTNVGLWSDTSASAIWHIANIDVNGDTINFKRPRRLTSSGSKTVAASGYYNLCTLSIPKDSGSWLIFSYVSSSTGTSHQIMNEIQVSGASYNINQTARGTNASGGGTTNWAYIETSESAATSVTLRSYGYYTTSHTESGKLFAVQII